MLNAVITLTAAFVIGFPFLICLEYAFRENSKQTFINFLKERF